MPFLYGNKVIYVEKFKYLGITNKYKRHSGNGSPGELSEELVTYEKRKKGWRMNCDVSEATEGLENEP